MPPDTPHLSIVERLISLPDLLSAVGKEHLAAFSSSIDELVSTACASGETAAIAAHYKLQETLAIYPGLRHLLSRESTHLTLQPPDPADTRTDAAIDDKKTSVENRLEFHECLQELQRKIRAIRTTSKENSP